MERIRQFWAELNFESLILARLESLAGILAIGFSAMDWSPLLGLDLTWQQRLGLGLVLFVKGFTSEWARRRRDPALSRKARDAELTAALAAELERDRILSPCSAP